MGPPSHDESALIEKVTVVTLPMIHQESDLQGPDGIRSTLDEKPEYHICVTDPRRADQPGFLGLNSEGDVTS